MKYVIVKADDKEFPIIFPEALVHKNVAIYIQTMLHNYHNIPVDQLSVTSAGFIPSATLEATCSGKSETLGIGVLPGDSDFIRTIDYNTGDRSTVPMLLSIIDKAKNGAVIGVDLGAGDES